MQKIKKPLRIFIFIAVTLSVLYFSGPRPAAPHYTNVLPAVPTDVAGLNSYIAQTERMHRLKPENEARIVWANDSTPGPTEYAIVYLHGFSASQEEGAPVHLNIAKKFGCNLYLARLAEHGIDTTEQLLNLTAERYWESVKQAYAIGKQLGKKVILMGTSTGGSNALQLAATFPEVTALVLLSPNIAINDPNAWIANNPWGLQIGRWVMHSNYVTPQDTTEIYKRYWNSPYRLEAVVALQEYLETVMIPATFQKIRQPTLMLYYYQDEQHQDPVVKVSAMKEMFRQLGTPTALKVEKAMPNTGTHVIGSAIKSNDFQSVEAEITYFLMRVLNLQLRGD